MRLSGRFTLENISVGELGDLIDFLNTPVGQLLVKRRLDGAKSTRR